MGSASSGGRTSWDAAVSAFISSFNSIYAENETFLCANKISGETFKFGMTLAISASDTTITLTTRGLCVGQQVFF